MRKIIILLSTIFITLASLLALPSIVMAQPNVGGDCDGFTIGSDDDFFGETCFQTFQPFQGVADGGILAALGELFGLLLTVIFLFWIVSFLLILWNYIKNQGQNPDEITQNWEYVQYFWRGITLVMFTFIIVTLLGVIAGLGNPFEWGDVLYQCGEDQELYLSGEEDIREQLDDLGITTGKVDIYCCENDSQPGGWMYTYNNLPAGIEAGIDLQNDCERFETFELD
jgi:hypothetical protein